MQPNKQQIAAQNLCLESLKTANNLTLWDCFISHETIYCNGVLAFMLERKAKPNTGMLFLCDTTYHVKIGKRGAVYSYRVNFTEKQNLPFKRNTYRVFI